MLCGDDHIWIGFGVKVLLSVKVLSRRGCAIYPRRRYRNVLLPRNHLVDF